MPSDSTTAIKFRPAWSNSNQTLLLFLIRFCFESGLIDRFPKLLRIGLFIVVNNGGESLFVADGSALDSFDSSQCTLDTHGTCAASHAADLDLGLHVFGKGRSGKKKQKKQRSE